MSSKINQFAFTLVELLIIIAIIGIISTATVTTLNNAKAKARDARRISDITQVIRVVEIYNYFEGEYPDFQECEEFIGPNLEGCNSLNMHSTWIPTLIKYLDQPLPIDPINYLDENDFENSYFYFYTRFSNPNRYYILYRLESQEQKNECDIEGLEDKSISCKGGG